MRFAIKRPNALFWFGQHTLDEVAWMRDQGHLQNEWLVCPRGCAGEAMTVGELLADRDVYDRRERERAAERQRLAAVANAVANAVDVPWLLVQGKRMLTFTARYYLVAQGIAMIFAPGRGNGMTPLAWLLVIPLWAAIAACVLLGVPGWLQYRRRVKLAVRAARRSSK